MASPTRRRHRYSDRACAINITRVTQPRPKRQFPSRVGSDVVESEMRQSWPVCWLRVWAGWDRARTRAGRGRGRAEAGPGG